LWDTSIGELGQRSGIFRRYGIDLDILYTQEGPEAQQAVISGSMQLLCGGGIEAIIGAYSRGAPLRIIGSEMIGSPDTYWYVLADSPIHSLKDAAGKTISYSQNGSSSHAAVLALLTQYNVDAKPVATGGHPVTLTMTMSGQIDIGRGAAPIGLDLVEQGKIRIIARSSEVRERSDQTVRVCAGNLDTLNTRAEAVRRFMQAYRDTIDWMYSDAAALEMYAEFSRVPATAMRKARDEFFPKSTIWPDQIRGIDLILADVLKNKFIASPLRPEAVVQMIQVPKPLK
jgi:NitT/TauT family transport system substrate-binding protein